MANSIYYGENARSTTINAERDTHAAFTAFGYVEMDPADTDLLAALNAQGVCLVDKEGSAETLTDGTVQTATTLSALVIYNGAAETTMTGKLLDTDGAIVFGPITIAANAERVIVFPRQITDITGGLFIETPTGALAATPGFLIP